MSLRTGPIVLTVTLLLADLPSTFCRRAIAGEPAEHTEDRSEQNSKMDLYIFAKCYYTILLTATTKVFIAHLYKDKNSITKQN